jgi:hypothetical protein
VAEWIGLETSSSNTGKMAAALDEPSPEEPGEPLPVVEGRSNRGGWIGVGFAALLAIGSSWWWLPKADHPGGRKETPKAAPAAEVKPPASAPALTATLWLTRSPAEHAAFLREVAAQPPERQVARVVAKLKELNPGYDGGETHTIEKGSVTGLALPFSPNAGAPIIDLSPVSALRQLNYFHCSSDKLTDLSPLQGLPLDRLVTQFAPIEDLSPLRGLPLTWLTIGWGAVTNLAPIQGMKIVTLAICGPVSDLSPLRGLPLATINLTRTKVTDLSPLAGLKLKNVSIFESPGITSLEPLLGTPIEELQCEFVPERDAAVLRCFKTLKNINNLPAAEFWRKANAGYDNLFNGRTLDGWRLRDPDPLRRSWRAQNGTLANSVSDPNRATDLASEAWFKDFTFHCEYLLSRGGNSGVLLRGCYEIQLLDDANKPPGVESSGAVYKLIAPVQVASRRVSEWQQLEARIKGDRVTVFLNGVKVIDGAPLGRPPSAEFAGNPSDAGPIILQGSLSTVSFRNLQIEALK